MGINQGKTIVYDVKKEKSDFQILEYGQSKSNMLNFLPTYMFDLFFIFNALSLWDDWTWLNYCGFGC